MTYISSDDGVSDRLCPLASEESPERCQVQLGAHCVRPANTLRYTWGKSPSIIVRNGSHLLNNVVSLKVPSLDFSSSHTIISHLVCIFMYVMWLQFFVCELFRSN